MKIYGIILLFLSFSFLGFYISERYISYIKDIKRVDLLVKNILLCIESENMTVSEIFDFAKNSGDKKTKDFLDSISPKNFSEIEDKAVLSDFCKDKITNSTLEEVFSVLGKYSAKEQIREISFCRNKILSYYDKNEKFFIEKAKLSKYFGILAGILFSILLI